MFLLLLACVSSILIDGKIKWIGNFLYCCALDPDLIDALPPTPHGVQRIDHALNCLPTKVSAGPLGFSLTKNTTFQPEKYATESNLKSNLDLDRDTFDELDHQENNARMDDSIPLTPELPERKNRLSSNSGIKRNKVSRACDECRKRKVRCDGAQPCARCQKSSTECIFSNVTPKRGPPKKYLEPFETRLKTIDQVLKHLEILTDNVEIEKGNDSWDVKDPSAIETNTHLNVTAIGRAMYMPDLPAKKDRIEPLHNADVNFEPPQPSIMDNAASVTLRFDLIQCYFDRIHPSMPFIAKSTLTGSKPSALLLNAIYAVSSKFAPSTTSTAQRSMDPPGWSYYKAAMSLMDTYLDVPRLSTIQALLLLVKYHEHIHRPGFFWRTKFLLQLAVAMATDLGLSGNMVKEIEQCKRGTEMTRRTFWAVYTYQVLMSTEQGSALQPASKECTVDYPHVLSDESGPDASIASAFHWLAKVIHIQAAVIEFMRSKYSIDNSTSSHNDETHEFDLIEHTLSNLGARIPSMSEGGGRLVSFVHIIYHLTVILLHRPYALEDKRATFVNRCLASASTITQIVEQLLNTEGAESLATVFRGHQQIVYCLTAAITVQRALKSTDPAVNDMYDKTHSLLQCMASKSPVTELETSAADNFFQTEKTDQHTKSPSNASSARSSPLIPSLNSPHSPSIPAPTIRKRHSRSSLQFPASDMSYVMQSSASFVPEVVGHRMRPAGRSPYASNRLSAPLLGSLYQQSPYFYQQQLQQQQMHHQMQLQQQQQQQQQQRLSSYSQPSSPTTSQFSGNNDYNAPPASVTPRRTTSLSRKTGLRRSASSTGEFVVPSQRPPRTSSRPYINPRRHTLTNTTPPDLSNVIAVVPPHSNTPMLDTNTNVTSTPRTLHAMAVRNNRFSAPVMSNNTQHPYMIPITSQQQQQYQFQQQQQQQQQQQRQHQMQYQYQQQNQQQMQQQQQQQMQQQMQQQHQIHHQQQHQQQQEEPYHQPMMIDHASFPMDPVIPDSPNESMMGLLMNPWDFPREP